MIKIVVTDYSFNFKSKPYMVGDYFKKFKTIVTNYSFDDMARRHYFKTCIILRIFFIKKITLAQSSRKSNIEPKILLGNDS